MIIDTKGDIVLEKCLSEYNKLKPEKRLEMSHFELADATAIRNSDAWLKFLSDPDVKRSRAEEVKVYKESQTNKLISRVTSNDKSVGAAQLISALTKEDKTEEKREGPVCIYTYVPTNARQDLADNVQKLDSDVFQE